MKNLMLRAYNKSIGKMVRSLESLGATSGCGMIHAVGSILKKTVQTIYPQYGGHTQHAAIFSTRSFQRQVPQLPLHFHFQPS
ncbi:hypothetical protein PoB_004428500 [Plakobranchus ocellatus]|uniref:Uncharacterized protein n=1 Tax=Plakobranchus ocellatus TaxID=259542 RepID=A0AAV4BDZ3_9GAST|nr:hypothetical protein PoB_004428500 [Plakobranchus ocellatus]